MPLGFGCVHPEGEGDEYDGLYYKQNELQALSEDLVGKPLYIEHVPEAVGEITQAWVGRKKPACYAMFETSDDYMGYFANNLIDKGVCGDLSLGHNVLVDQDAGKVVKKSATEVSICGKGARPDTHILAFRKNVPSSIQTKKGKYMIHVTSSLSTMSDQTAATSTPTQPAEATTSNTSDAAPSSSTSSPVLSELLAQLKDQTAQINSWKEKHTSTEAALKQANEERTAYQQQLDTLQASNKRKREEAIEGTIKDFVENMIKKYQKELKPHADDLANMFQGMKNSAQAEPMLALLECAAASGKASTTQLEKAYQETKSLKEQIQSVKKEVIGLKTPQFETSSERFAKKARVAAPTASAVRMPTGMTLPTASKSGMQNAYPDLWSKLMTTGPNVGPGMGWFSESTLVGKEYHDGRRPANINKVN